MSRLIIKNLPKGIKEDRLKKLFSEHGNVTDCALKFTKDGVFRKFAFVGYNSPEEADRARKYFDRTFIDTSRIQVEFARNFGDADKPRAWSKYSKESSSYQAKQAEQGALTQEEGKDKTQSKSEKKKKAKEERLNEMLGELKDDPGFEEFMSVHQNISAKTTWSNDTMATQQDREQTTATITQTDSGNSSAESDTEIEQPKKVTKKGKVERKTESEAHKSSLSDLEYLKSKVGGEDLEESSSSSEEEEEEKTTPASKPSKRRTDSSSSESDTDSESKVKISRKGDNSSKPPISKKTTSPKTQKGDKTKGTEISSTEKNAADVARFVVKLRGFQGNIGEKAISEFFNPLKVKSIRIPRNAKRKPIGIAYIDFNSEKDLDQALRKNKNFIGGKRVFLKKVASDVVEETAPKLRPWELKKATEEEGEGIGESGRLYVRNLAYVCTEDQLQQLFSKYGLLTEVNLPVDRLTRKIKGFAHITFMMPEHAVKAYTELDGSVFLGRMMHILPGKPRKEEQFEVTEKSSFKKQKAAKEKAAAGSSHNWNSLFLGANAVADVMANKYNTTKSQILDAEASQSLGVRVALGETQVVAETRDFLTENGVRLDSFSQPSAPRSKTVILVKNLPAGTKPEELRGVFSHHGVLGRVVLPPSGISAIIEFLEAPEARAAFTKLAYTKFKHVPLYLEWAPMEVFESRLQPSVTTRDGEMETDQPSGSKQKDEDGESDDGSEIPGTVLFVKNLNFDTREDGLRELFKACGPIKSVTVAKKKDMKNPGELLSMGYGFVQYSTVQSAQQALKELQYTELDGHQLQLKVSNRTTLQPATSGKKKQVELKQKSSKILVRNVPFEAKAHEILELFKVFGELKSVRLPKKLGGTGRHRGFGFVDFLTKNDAKRAFEALCQSTHLYGRRLVLEWAEAEENIDDLRKKTAEHFHDDSPRKRLKKANIMEALGE